MKKYLMLVLATFWNLPRVNGPAPHVSMTGKQSTTLPNCPATSASADEACLDLLEASIVKPSTLYMTGRRLKNMIGAKELTRNENATPKMSRNKKYRFYCE